jgi:LmbE family N-acetylglucosaminyl deacetylase
MPAPESLTDEARWLSLLQYVPQWRPPSIPTIVVAPHPDDETLGAGGLIAAQGEIGIKVSIIAVSDGEAAYENFPELAAVRCAEQRAAAAELGVTCENLIRFGLPDSAISLYENRLADMIAAHINSKTLLMAPWPSDPHPDHEACGRASRIAATITGAKLVYYIFWTWHRNTAESLRGMPLGRFEVSASLQARRDAALDCYRSQIERKEGEPILPQTYLAPARRSFETFIIPA